MQGQQGEMVERTLIEEMGSSAHVPTVAGPSRELIR